MLSRYVHRGELWDLLNVVVLTEIYQEAKREKVEEANEECTVVPNHFRRLV